MNAYSLPTDLIIHGNEFQIRTDYRAILDILTAASDPDLNALEKQEVMFQILYVDYEKIPARDYLEACQKAAEFIDGGTIEHKKKPKILDWEQDAPIIIPAINKVAGMEIRSLEYLHWWTFLGFFMEVEDGLFSQVIAIRQKRAKHKKLEKWEREFERENPELVRLHTKQSEEQKREIKSIEKWL